MWIPPFQFRYNTLPKKTSARFSCEQNLSIENIAAVSNWSLVKTISVNRKYHIRGFARFPFASLPSRASFVYALETAEFSPFPATYCNSSFRSDGQLTFKYLNPSDCTTAAKFIRTKKKKEICQEVEWHELPLKHYLGFALYEKRDISRICFAWKKDIQCMDLLPIMGSRKVDTWSLILTNKEVIFMNNNHILTMACETQAFEICFKWMLMLLNLWQFLPSIDNIDEVSYSTWSIRNIK